MMIKLKRFVFLLGIVAMAQGGFAQSAKDLKINEVLLINKTSYLDNFGDRSAWIEIFNTAYNKVNIAGCYLTDDLNNPKKYRIAKSDPNTVIPTRAFTIFFVDDKTTHGTFHTNFVLDSTSRFIALFDVNGRTLIDSMTLPPMKADVSYGRYTDGGAKLAFLKQNTPMATNFTDEVVPAGTRFASADPYGFGMTVTAMSVVFFALILLYLVFKQVGKRNIRAQRVKNAGAATGSLESAEVSGEVFAAISAALYLYETEQHDQESAILTINRVAKSYSPWSSKLYGLTQTPQKQNRKPEFNR
ncbi:MAG TPA: OadG family transporter subunit [Williamwhitmania sp.]|nr:OadG family transporter subunit [Williamwhitmania sp.]